MNADAFLDELLRDPNYKGQIVYVHEHPAREATYAAPDNPAVRLAGDLAAKAGIKQLYSHLADAIGHSLAGRDVLVCTGPTWEAITCILAALSKRAA